MPSETLERRQRILVGLRGRNLEQAATDPALMADLRAEADSPEPRLVPPDLVKLIDSTRAARAARPTLGISITPEDVILIPGFLGSELVDVKGSDGLIWIDPAMLITGTDRLLDLRLADYVANSPDSDASQDVGIQANGAIPVFYSALPLALQLSLYHVDVFGFDWRKNIDESATVLADTIRGRASQRSRPLHLIAHSQGSLVARRALQLVGADLARQLVSNLVLLGPASAGTFEAAAPQRAQKPRPSAKMNPAEKNPAGIQPPHRCRFNRRLLRHPRRLHPLPAALPWCECACTGTGWATAFC
jgi:pimeloyl-ACP methyl ester carboxylesterase